MKEVKSISRRRLLQAIGAAGTAGTCLSCDVALGANHKPAPRNRRAISWDPGKLGMPMMRDPVWVYDNWSAYAEGVPELTDTRLTETLAMRQLQQVVRLKTLGVHFDYYMMNAFWFAPDGAYREWRKQDWPNGPDRWIAACHENGLKPGMWFGTNTLWQIEAAPQWRDSLAVKGNPKWKIGVMSLYEGGFLADFMATIQYWYQRGIRMFEFDAADFHAVTAEALKTQSESDVRERNSRALSDALKSFRRKNPDAMLVAFNDFGGDRTSTASPFPFENHVDLRWLGVFDSLYSGDTRASDVPQANFWRSMDLYNDHMVRRYEQSGVPLERIDPFFTLSTTWFGYSRGKRAWKGMLLLTLARGSWKKTIYGSLDLLNDEEARWFAKAQQMFAPLLAMGRTKTFGGIPGEVEPYGFGSFDIGGALYTVMNPTQEVRNVELPLLSAAQGPLHEGRVLFRDAGFSPRLGQSEITLGPGQMALVGFGRYSQAEHDLGIQLDVVIPRTIRSVAAKTISTGTNTLEVRLTAPAQGDLRIFFQQRRKDGSVLKDLKIKGKIDARQEGRSVPIEADMDGSVEGYGGLSWSACEIRQGAFASNRPIEIRYSVDADEPAVLQGNMYVVEY
jgi:hypothetical protein